ncbi:MAG: zf-HC2 domain-containing protein [Gemmatimonadales bacterium]
MRHPDVELQVDAWLDGELAAAEAEALERHLAQCAACNRHRDQRVALSRAVRAALPHREPSDLLRQQVRQGLAEARRREERRRGPRGWQWLAVAASLVVVALGSWTLGSQHGGAGAVEDEVLKSHVRSLMPGHLTDVLSSDQHTVKPWFNGVLDYSPPVYDFAGRGYPLVGGRLDYIGGRKVASLVYARRKHLISVMVWPRSEGEDGGRPGFRQGYNLLHWSTPAYVYWVASDLGHPELVDFTRLLQQSDSMTGADSE